MSTRGSEDLMTRRHERVGKKNRGILNLMYEVLRIFRFKRKRSSKSCKWNCACVSCETELKNCCREWISPTIENLSLACFSKRHLGQAAKMYGMLAPKVQPCLMDTVRVHGNSIFRTRRLRVWRRGDSIPYSLAEPPIVGIQYQHPSTPYE